MLGRVDGRGGRTVRDRGDDLGARHHDTDITTDADTSDRRDFQGPYARHHVTIDRRGRRAMKLARPPEIFAAGLARALEDKAGFARRPVGLDARMLLTANRFLPSAGVHQMARLAMGLPRMGALRPSAVNDETERASPLTAVRKWMSAVAVRTMGAHSVLEYGEIGSFTGVDAVTEFMDQSHAMAGHTMHRLGSIVITLDGDTATARTYVDGLILAADNASGVDAVGFYDDVMVRTDHGWRIARRVFTALRIAAVRGCAATAG